MNWKGGSYRCGQGYVHVLRPDHPNSFKSNGYVPEHVLVMTASLGRPLMKGETVHHRNGVRDDNRLENLELWGKPHGKGIRRADAVTYAFEVLTQLAKDEGYVDS